MEICLYENGSVDIAGRKLGVCTHHEFFSEDETFPNKKYLLKDNLYTYVHFRIKSPNLLDLQKIGIPTDINEILHSQGVGGAAFLSGNGAILAMGHFPEGYIILNKDSVCTDYFIKTNHIQFTDIIFIHSKMPPSDKCRLLELSDEPGFDVVLQKLSTYLPPLQNEKHREILVKNNIKPHLYWLYSMNYFENLQNLVPVDAVKSQLRTIFTADEYYKSEAHALPDQILEAWLTKGKFKAGGFRRGFECHPLVLHDLLAMPAVVDLLRGSHLWGLLSAFSLKQELAELYAGVALAEDF